MTKLVLSVLFILSPIRFLSLIFFFNDKFNIKFESLLRRVTYLTYLDKISDEFDIYSFLSFANFNQLLFYFFFVVFDNFLNILILNGK